MGDLMTSGSAQLPAHLQQYAGNSDAASMVTTVASLPALSIRGKQFRFRNGDQEQVLPAGQPIEVVVLAVDPPQGVASSYYIKAYTGNTDDQPDCASSDGITPDGHVSSPQARTCAECPHNAFGTAKDANGNPGKGKACSDHKNLIVVQATDIENNELMMLRVPATSLRSLSRYGQKLAEHNVPPHMVVTELTFMDAEYPLLDFNPARWLSEAEAPVADKRSKSDAVRLSCPSTGKVAVNVEPVAALPSAPSAPPKELVMTDKAEGRTHEVFIDAGWNDDQLIEHGYAEYK